MFNWIYYWFAPRPNKFILFNNCIIPIDQIKFIECSYSNGIITVYFLTNHDGNLDKLFLDCLTNKQAKRIFQALKRQCRV